MFPTPHSSHRGHLLVFDHLTRRVALLHDGPEAERKALRRDVIRCLRGPIPSSNGDVEISKTEASFSEAEFCDRVEACKEYIASGDIYQIVISVLFRGRSNVSPFEVYRALRLLNPSPYMFFLEFGDLKVVGSSPEALVKLQRQYRIAAAHRGNAAARGDDGRRCRQ